MRSPHMLFVLIAALPMLMPAAVADDVSQGTPPVYENVPIPGIGGSATCPVDACTNGTTVPGVSTPGVTTCDLPGPLCLTVNPQENVTRPVPVPPLCSEITCAVNIGQVTQPANVSVYSEGASITLVGVGDMTQVQPVPFGDPNGLVSGTICPNNNPCFVPAAPAGSFGTGSVTVCATAQGTTECTGTA